MSDKSKYNKVQSQYTDSMDFFEFDETGIPKVNVKRLSEWASKMQNELIENRKLVNEYKEVIFKQNKNIENQQKDIKKDIEDSKTRIKNQKKFFAKRIKTSNRKINSKIEDAKTGTTESLALFAAFFTFVAVNVQIFTKVTNLRSAMWFSILLLGCLGFFAVIVHLIILKREYKKISIIIGVLLVIFSIFISLGLIFGNEKLYENEGNNLKVNNSSINTLNNDQASTSPKIK